MIKPMKSNDLGAFLEDGVKDVCKEMGLTLFRLHTIRSFKGVSNPCDFILLGRTFTALLECKATNDNSFSCANFTQLPYFEEASKIPHIAIYGLLIYFHSDTPKYVFVSDYQVMKNKENRCHVRPNNEKSYTYCASSLKEILELFG